MAKHGLWTEEEVVLAFKSGEAITALSKRIGGSPNTIRKVLKAHLGGVYLVQRNGNRPKYRAWNRSEASHAEVVRAFSSDVGFSRIAKDLKISPSSLRELWVEEFGAAAVQERSYAHLAASGVKTGTAGKGVKKTKRMVTDPCAECGVIVELSAMSRSKQRRLTCAACLNLRSKVSVRCPVCGAGCVGKKGLMTHYRHFADSPEHVAHFQISREALLGYTTKNGKVIIGWAALGLDRSANFVKKEARRHGLKTFGRYIKQGECLGAVSRVLGGAVFTQEWLKPGSVNGYRFDGYFPSHNLVVEFHGYQHWVFPNVYFKSEAKYLAMLERDKEKEAMIRSDPSLHYLVLREDEPYTDVAYLRTKLKAEGIHG